MPGLYKNLREDSGNIKFFGTERAPINYEDADSLYMKSLKAKNQPLREYIDTIADNEES
jgi:hypothetical protein